MAKPDAVPPGVAPLVLVATGMPKTTPAALVEWALVTTELEPDVVTVKEPELALEADTAPEDVGRQKAAGASPRDKAAAANNVRICIRLLPELRPFWTPPFFAHHGQFSPSAIIMAVWP